jgi:hypothetical protein
MPHWTSNRVGRIVAFVKWNGFGHGFHGGHGLYPLGSIALMFWLSTTSFVRRVFRVVRVQSIEPLSVSSNPSSPCAHYRTRSHLVQRRPWTGLNDGFCCKETQRHTPLARRWQIIKTKGRLLAVARRIVCRSAVRESKVVCPSVRCADPHARRCGRGAGAILAPIPIRVVRLCVLCSPTFNP